MNAIGAGHKAFGVFGDCAYHLYCLFRPRIRSILVS